MTKIGVANKTYASQPIRLIVASYKHQALVSGGSGSRSGSRHSRPLGTGRAPFRRIRLEHRTTSLRDTIGRGSAVPRHPITRRGCPIGLGNNLSVTTAGPATEMTTVAAVAPAEVLATLPTSLHHSLRRLADGSRPPTPEGSLPAFAWGDVATPIRPITGRHSLSPSSFTCCPIGWPCGSLSLTHLEAKEGRQQGYHVSPMYPRGKVASLRRWRDICAGGVRGLRTWPRTFLVQAIQQLALVLCDDAYDALPGLTIPRHLGSRPPLLLAVAVAACALAALRRRRLRCPGAYYPGKILLAEQQVWSVLSESLHTATSATSCRTRTISSAAGSRGERRRSPGAVIA